MTYYKVYYELAPAYKSESWSQMPGEEPVSMGGHEYSAIIDTKWFSTFAEAFEFAKDKKKTRIAKVYEIGCAG